MKTWLKIFSVWLFSVWNLFAYELKLSWDAPTTNVDGTAVTNEVKYKVYYGSSSRSYDHTQYVGTATEVSITNVTPSDRYFAVKAFYPDLSGESDYSSELRWFLYNVNYSQEPYIAVEGEDVILDPYVTTSSVNGVTYIYNPSNDHGVANFTFLYFTSPSNMLPATNQFVLWFRSRSIAGIGRFFIDSISSSWVGETNNMIVRNDKWNVTTESSTNWHWEQLKQTNGSPIIIPVCTNTYITYAISLTNNYTWVDKFLFTTNLNYTPDAPILPVYTYNYFTGSEFTLETNVVTVSWLNVPNATTYKVYGKWNDTTTGQQYYYGSTVNNYMSVPMSRTGHFYYYVDAFNGTSKISTIRSDVSNSTFFVHGYTNNLPWKIYWKVPPPTGIIID